MGNNRNKTLAEKRDYIIKALEWLEVVPTDTFSKKLEDAKNIVVSDYLDEVLIPLIPKLFTEKDPRIPNLISLCFAGHLSQTAWDIVWKQIPNEKDQLLYATQNYDSSTPLTIAACHGNLAALKRLDALYQQCLPQQPARRHIALYQIRQALLETHESDEIGNLQKASSYKFLLVMLERYATLINENATQSGFSNKQIGYKKNGQFLMNSGETPLLDAFADIGAAHICAAHYKKQTPAFYRLSHYVRLQGTEEDFNQFKERVLSLLDNRYHCSSKKRQEIQQKLDHLAEIVKPQKKEDIEKHKQLYLQAYQNQESQHTWRRYLGKVAALVAVFVPPVSLVFTIYSLMNDAHQKAKPLWQKIAEGFLLAITPLASGIFSWRVVDKTEVGRRAKDPIQKISMTQYEQEKTHRANRKNSMTHINWQWLEKKKAEIKKPKKVIIGQDVYLDRAQAQRRRVLLTDGAFGTYQCKATFFKDSYQQSADIVKKLQENNSAVSSSNKTARKLM